MPGKEVIDTVIKSYQDKLKINPASLVFVQLADAHRKKGSLDEALQVCKDGLTRHPNLLSGMLMMGRVYSARKEYDDAVDILQKVVHREPGNLTAHALLSQSFLALGKYQDAIGEYQKILTLNPEDAAAQQALKAALEQMRRASSAAREGAAAKQEAPERPAKQETPGVAESPAAKEEAPASVAPVPSPEPATQESISEEPQPSALEFALPAAPAPSAPEIPAYAAAEELAERGLYDEAIEAFQRILEVDPDNFMARQKLREVYARREATETPMPVAQPAGQPVAPVTTQADKITDDEILHLLGLMEGGGPPPAAESPAAPPTAAPASPPPPAAPVEAPAAAPETAPAKAEAPPSRAEAPAPKVPASAAREEAVPRESVPAPAMRSSGLNLPARIPGGGAVDEILKRLAGTAGMREAFLVAEEEMKSSGEAPSAEQGQKLMTIVKMLAEVTKKASSGMKQGEVRQVLVFGTEGMVMVSPSNPGILAAVAGSGVNVGLLRLALNDCLRRLAEVS